ncbi:MAG: DUF2946 family protein [Rhodospirillales bacterium]
MPVLALFLLAAALQLALPVAFFGAIAAPFDAGAFCYAAAPSDSAEGEGGSGAGHGNLCPLCQIAVASQTALPAEAPAIVTSDPASEPVGFGPSHAPAAHGHGHLRPPTRAPPALG